MQTMIQKHTKIKEQLIKAKERAKATSDKHKEQILFLEKKLSENEAKAVQEMVERILALKEEGDEIGLDFEKALRLVKDEIEAEEFSKDPIKVVKRTQSHPFYGTNTALGFALDYILKNPGATSAEILQCSKQMGHGYAYQTIMCTTSQLRNENWVKYEGTAARRHYPV
jgi:hypothetical protein